MTALGFVAAAAIGTVIRWQSGVRLPRPIGTLLVNIAGSFALGVLHGSEAGDLTVVGVGGIGALTTFSTVAQELIDLWEHRRDAAVVYATTTLIGAIGAAILGLRLA